MAIVPIKGLWETHLTVSGLDRSIGFYRDVLGLTLAHAVPERHVAFFWDSRDRRCLACGAPKPRRSGIPEHLQ